jgi:cytochrome oxidase Cu insertion factor (SCO1/SenC/PrrC family)
MLSVQETDPAQRTSEDDLFIHSTLFVLVDGQANVRAIYESNETNIEQRITADLKKLLKK